MTIICIEGPSAVGKTTLARALAERIGAVAVPEVNQLFRRPPDEEPTWYLERQLDRWRLACGAEATGKVAVLDGDVFQPLWYGWAYGFLEPNSLHDLLAFYRPLLLSGELDFPDAYFVLECSADELFRRKEQDATRTRRNFDRHLQLIGPQGRYFACLEATSPGLVVRLTSTAAEVCSRTLEEFLKNNPHRKRPAATATIIDALADLLRGPPR